MADVNVNTCLSLAETAREHIVAGATSLAHRLTRDDVEAVRGLLLAVSALDELLDELGAVEAERPALQDLRERITRAGGRVRDGGIVLPFPGGDVTLATDGAP